MYWKAGPKVGHWFISCQCSTSYSADFHEKTNKTFRRMFDLACINVIICCIIPHFALFVLVHLRSAPCAVVRHRSRSPGSKSLWICASGQRRSPHNELISAISTVMPLSANRKWHRRELSWCYEVNQASNNYVHRSAITRTAVPMETMVKLSTILAVV